MLPVSFTAPQSINDARLFYNHKLFIQSYRFRKRQSHIKSLLPNFATARGIHKWHYGHVLHTIPILTEQHIPQP